MKKSFILAVVAAVIFGGAGFYGGMKYDQSRTAAQRQQRVQQFGNGVGVGTNINGNFRGNRDGNSGSFVSGEIIAKDEQSITVKVPDGGSKIVFFSDKTAVSKFVSGALSDLVVGENIIITGTANSDGSVTAQSVQIRPAMLSPSVTP